LTERQVRRILHAGLEGQPSRVIASQYACSMHTVAGIWARRKWAWVSL
jgi:DNA invertase Pin-like site-specific DNA recombinase